MLVLGDCEPVPLHANTNFGAEITDPREKKTSDFARKRFPDAAHEQPPPEAGPVLFCSRTILHGGPDGVPVLLSSTEFPEHAGWPSTFSRQWCTVLRSLHLK